MIPRRSGARALGRGEGLRPRIARKAAARLRFVALGAAAVHLLSLGLDLVNHLLGFAMPLHQGAKNAISVTLIVLSLLVYRACRGPLARMAWLPSVYHVIVAFGVELSAQLTPWPTAAHVPYQLMRTVSWVALWIVVYPLFVPTPPRRAALTAISAAAAGPAALFVTVLLGNAYPGLGAASFLHLPNLVAAGLAIVGARLVFGLEEEASVGRLLGNFVLKRRIARGGMGEVWEATHRLLARPAAVKLIPPGEEADLELRQRRFEREARATARLTSPHTVGLYDYGRAEDGTFYYVMELLAGMDLEELVRRYGPQPPARAVHILRQVCDSLAEAHEQGLLHRDIKPSNIVIGPRGVSGDDAKVLDFGLVLAFGKGASTETRLTRDENLRGTPSYTAPEVALDEPPIDGRADLYSLGCVAYWLLSGAPPFERGAPLKTLLAQVQDPPDAFDPELAVPADLEALVMRCLAKSPAARPPDARALIRELTRCECAAAWTGHEAEAFWAAESST